MEPRESDADKELFSLDRLTLKIQAPESFEACITFHTAQNQLYRCDDFKSSNRINCLDYFDLRQVLFYYALILGQLDLEKLYFVRRSLNALFVRLKQRPVLRTILQCHVLKHYPQYLFSKSLSLQPPLNASHEVFLQ